MVAGVVLPNVIAAIVARLKGDPDVVALCSQGVPVGREPRIAAGFPESSDDSYRWRMPHFAVIVQRAGGPPGDVDIGLQFARFDVRCFGPGRTLTTRQRLADQLWRTVHPALCPPPYYPTGFHAAGTLVQQIYAEGEALTDVEPGTDWPIVVCSYIAMYMSRQVAA